MASRKDNKDRVLQKGEAQRTDGRYHSIFTVMLGTGLRVGELCGLRWQDVDIEKRVIDVNHGVVHIKAVKGGKKEHLAISLPKTKAGIRQVPIMQPVVNAIMEEYKWRILNILSAIPLMVTQILSLQSKTEVCIPPQDLIKR